MGTIQDLAGARVYPRYLDEAAQIGLRDALRAVAKAAPDGGWAQDECADDQCGAFGLGHGSRRISL